MKNHLIFSLIFGRKDHRETRKNFGWGFEARFCSTLIIATPF